MRIIDYFLSIYTFLVVCGVFFLVIPLIFIVTGLLLGLSAFYFGFNTLLADAFVHIGMAPWKFWYIFLPSNILITVAVLVFTHYARKTSTYRKMRV